MTNTTHEQYMQRCLELASLAAGQVSPNPMVGAVLVHEGRIIGEGYHRQYGQPHAEVNCIAAVAESDRHLIEQSVMYVSLEPCAHHGKTPPCADLIIRHRIPTVVVGCRDPFPLVDGKGIEKLQAAGVTVITGVLEEEAKALNKRFFTFHTKHRPYIILKWAQTEDGYVGNEDHSRLKISSALTNRIVHKWRAEEAAIMVGTNTVLYDDPLLNTRDWPGRDPVRVVPDRELRLPENRELFNRQSPSVILNTIKQEASDNLLYHLCAPDQFAITDWIQVLYTLNLQSILIEGGPSLLQSFIDAGLWDECRIITSHLLRAGKGIAAPVLSGAIAVHSEKSDTDTIGYFQKTSSH